MRLLESRLNEITVWLRKVDEEELRTKRWIIIFDRIDMTCLVIFQLLNIASIMTTVLSK